MILSFAPFFLLGCSSLFFTPRNARLSNSADKSRELRRTRRTDTRRGLLEKEKNEWIRKANASERVLSIFLSLFLFFRARSKMTMNSNPDHLAAYQRRARALDGSAEHMNGGYSPIPVSRDNDDDDDALRTTKKKMSWRVIVSAIFAVLFATTFALSRSGENNSRAKQSELDIEFAR